MPPPGSFPDELSLPRIAWSFASDAPESDCFATILRDLEIRFRQLLPPGLANKLAQLTSA